MNREFNQIIMKNGKSKLLRQLGWGKRLYIVLATGLDEHVVNHVPNGEVVGLFEDYNRFAEVVKDKGIYDDIAEFDSVIIYSNEPKSKSIKYIEIICRFIDIDKCIFMFGSEM